MNDLIPDLGGNRNQYIVDEEEELRLALEMSMREQEELQKLLIQQELQHQEDSIQKIQEHISQEKNMLESS